MMQYEVVKFYGFEQVIVVFVYQCIIIVDFDIFVLQFDQFLENIGCLVEQCVCQYGCFYMLQVGVGFVGIDLVGFCQFGVGNVEVMFCMVEKVLGQCFDQVFFGIQGVGRDGVGFYLVIIVEYVFLIVDEMMGFFGWGIIGEQGLVEMIDGIYGLCFCWLCYSVV